MSLGARCGMRLLLENRGRRATSRSLMKGVKGAQKGLLFHGHPLKTPAYHQRTPSVDHS
ncbi:MAG: hypothetical protein ACK5TR_00405 [Alphaproteobacteria bacterium]|jgi:hypothetical protein|nr:hypothetical protein [Alphaproteobacteria bacterium]